MQWAGVVWVPGAVLAARRLSAVGAGPRPSPEPPFCMQCGPCGPSAPVLRATTGPRSLRPRQDRRPARPPCESGAGTDPGGAARRGWGREDPPTLPASRAIAFCPGSRSPGGQHTAPGPRGFPEGFLGAGALGLFR